MFSTFCKFSEYLKKGEIRFTNNNLHNLMISYSFIHIIEDIDDKNEISQNFNESKIIIINQNTQSDTNSDELYFFISFQKTIIIIKQTSIAFLKSLFSKNKELKMDVVLMNNLIILVCLILEFHHLLHMAFL